MTRTSPLRSTYWFGGKDINGFVHRAWMHSEGLTDDVFDGRPVIGVANSYSEATNCNSHLRVVADFVKRGVWRAGGFPIEFPVLSPSEILMKPTTMLFRNLMAMDVEESIRALPLDGVVLLSGCDKTTPGMLLGAASANVPAILVTGGPMLGGRCGRERLGAGTDIFKFWDARRSGEMSEETWHEYEQAMGRTNGHCMVMGTASTMACVAEALGMTLPANAAIPAVDSRRLELADLSGQRIVQMAQDRLRPDTILTEEAFENATRTVLAIGGSTNAIIHLAALARRARQPYDLRTVDRLSRETPLLVNLQPSGEFLMEDFFYGGGLPAVLRELLPLLNGNAATVTGQTLAENVARARILDERVIRPLNDPLDSEGGLAVLFGNLCPDGAIIKRSAASPELLHHVGRAVVFESKQDLMTRINSPELDVDKDSVLVQQNGGPKGAPGMPEWGMLPIPEKLVRAGVKDMVRVSDARMSGTAFGTCVLHVAPESAVGGPLALVENGDEIELNVESRTLTLRVSPETLAVRQQEWTPPAPAFQRGFGRIYLDHVLQAPDGVDFDVLAGGPGEDLAPYMPTSH